MNNKDKLGNRIFYMRRCKHMKQKILAEKIGKSPSYLCDIEKGRTMPSLKVVYMIAEAMEISIAELFVD